MDFLKLLVPIIVVQALGLVGTVAMVASMSRSHEKRLDNVERKIEPMLGHEKRIADLERCVEELPTKYVPRTEVQLMLSGISRITEETKALIQALVYGGGDREVAKKALGPRQ